MFLVILQKLFSLRSLRVKNLADLANSRCDYFFFNYILSGVLQIKFEP